MTRRVAILLLSLTLLTVATQAQNNTLRRGTGTSIAAQRTTGSTGNSGNSHVAGPTADADVADSTEAMPKGIVFHTDLPDSALSASVFAFRHKPLEVKIMSVSHPAFNPTAVQHSDPLNRLDGNYYLEAGGLGHPHIAVYQDFSAPLGLSFKPCIYPAWYKTPQNVAFYQVQRPYSLLAYHSSLNKDYQLHVTHSQNITERWNFAFDYHLFSPQGVYSNSSATDHLLDFNTNYYSPDGRYQVRGGAIWQRFSLGENGGLTDDDAFIYHRISNPAGLPVVSSTASSRTSDLSLFASQSYNTVRQVPWYREHMEFLTDTANKIDTLIVVDTLYPSAPRILNSGVFGLDMQFDRQKYLGPASYLSTLTSQLQYDSILSHLYTATLYWTNDAYLDHHWRNPLKVTIGVRPYFSTTAIDTTRFTTDRITFTTLYPFANVIVAPWQWSKLSLLAESGPRYGEYQFDGSLDFTFDSSKHSRLHIRNTFKGKKHDIIYDVLLHQKGVTTQEPPLLKTVRSEIAFQYGNILDISLAHTTILNYQYLYRNESGVILPNWVPYGIFCHLTQARLGLNLQAWSWLHLDLQQLFQLPSDSAIHVPLFASKNSLYADFYLFHRALRTQIGVDLRYHTAFYADAYDPSLGLFYHQNDTKVGNYLYADFFINLQIKRASIYLKAGHLNSLLESEAHYYTLPHYPGNPFGLFYGLTWQFFD